MKNVNLNNIKSIDELNSLISIQSHIAMGNVIEREGFKGVKEILAELLEMKENFEKAVDCIYGNDFEGWVEIVKASVNPKHIIWNLPEMEGFYDKAVDLYNDEKEMRRYFEEQQKILRGDHEEFLKQIDRVSKELSA